MSSGSYFTIYRKCSKHIVDANVLDAIKNEYFLENKSGMLCKSDNDEEMKKDIPLLMDAGFKHEHMHEDNDESHTCYDANGTKHIKLLDFHFGSAFTCLKEHFGLNAYKFSQRSIIVPKSDAEKMLQAIEYVLSQEYSKKFERMLSNEYVDIFGNGYSPFDNRFRNTKPSMYVDRIESGKYSIEFSDWQYEREVAESDDDVEYVLKKVRACILAYLNADENIWDGEDLVLEYSAY